LSYTLYIPWESTFSNSCLSINSQYQIFEDITVQSDITNYFKYG